MLNKKFVIGIGSQRAGSTLLHRVLDECTDIFMHPIKELHYFDTLFGVRHPDVLKVFSNKQLDRELDKIIKSQDVSFTNSKKYKCFLRGNKILANNEVKDIDYIDLFRPCLMGNEIIGEITPEYMVLPEEGVKFMSEVVGKDSPIILITRDPVDRFISAFKLLKVYGNDSVDMSNFESELVDVFESMPEWVEHQKKLNDYELAFEKYSKYFNKVLKISYDELVNDIDITHKKLEETLNHPVDKQKYKKILGKKINQIGETSKLSLKVVELVKEKLVDEHGAR